MKISSKFRSVKKTFRKKMKNGSSGNLKKESVIFTTKAKEREFLRVIVKIRKMNRDYERQKMKKGRYYALDIADCVIQYCNSKKMPITNLALQKILYFIAGEFFKVSGRDAIIEDFEAWKHGPVIPAVYDRFSVYGGSPLQPLKDESAEIPPDDKTIICGVVDEWMSRPYWEFVRKTRDTDPWKNTYSMFGSLARISKSSMKAYFKKADD